MRTESAPGTLTTTYTYAGDSTRLAQSVNGATTRYVVDVSGQLPHVLEEHRDGHTVRYLYGAGVMGVETDGAMVYQHADALGSVRQLTDETGSVRQARGYSPFGAPTYAAGQSAGSFGFAGEQYDAASGLIYLRARYYDPTTGRFLTRDTYPALAPVPQSLHRYVYCGNDPVNRTDPSGQWWWDDAAKKVRQTWREITRPVRRAEQRVERWGERTERTVGRWRQNPRREAVRTLGSAASAISDFSTRKRAELTSDVHNMASNLERGDTEGVVASVAVYYLHLTGITDVRLARNVVGGMAGSFHGSVEHFNRNWAILSDPHANPEAQLGAYGEIWFAAGNIVTWGGVGDVRYGAQEGDWLRAASGAVQVLPGTGVLDEWLDIAVAGREVARGLESGNAAQIEMGMFGVALNVYQLHAGPGNALNVAERPLEHAARAMARSAGELTERTVRQAAGETAERFGRGARAVIQEAGRLLRNESGEASLEAASLGLGRLVPDAAEAATNVPGGIRRISVNSGNPWRDAQGRFATRPDRWAASRLAEGGLSDAETRALLNTIAEMSVYGELPEGAVVSLGRWKPTKGHPGYITWAKANDAAFFDMDEQVYATITGKTIGEATISWRVNEQFLDNAIEAGAVFRLQPVMPPPNTGFGRELIYLQRQGYRRVVDGGEWWMRR